MKIRIEKAQCAGNACCAAVAPDVFALDEKLARRGARACPERSIVIEEDKP
jgi:ferredoxin